MSYKQLVNFNEIAANGDYNIRITGGDAESKQRRMTLMNASEDMYEALKEARLQIEYLHDKFKVTGTGNQVLAKIDHVLNKAEGKA